MKRTQNRFCALCVSATLFLLAFIIIISQSQISNISRINSNEFQLRNSTLLLSSGGENGTNINKDDGEWFLSELLQILGSIPSLPLDNGRLASSVSLYKRLVNLLNSLPVETTSSSVLDEILQNAKLQSLRPNLITWSSTMEFFLESTFAQQIISEGKSHQNHLELGDYDNYRLLVRFEVNCLKMYMKKEDLNGIRKVAMIGAGPLPMTALELLRYLSENATIVNYDHSSEAIELGQAVAMMASTFSTSQGSFQNRMIFRKEAAFDIKDLRDADVVYLAALVGESPKEKKNIVKRLYKIMRPGAVLFARSGSGLRSIIYQEINPRVLTSAGFKNVKMFKPDRKGILSSVLLGIR